MRLSQKPEGELKYYYYYACPPLLVWLIDLLPCAFERKSRGLFKGIMTNGSFVVLLLISFADFSGFEIERSLSLELNHSNSIFGRVNFIRM